MKLISLLSFSGGLCVLRMVIHEMTRLERVVPEFQFNAYCYAALVQIQRAEFFEKR